MKRRIFAIILTLLLAATLVLPASAADPQAVVGETTILFTHDLHSHFLPQPTADGESGGYARLKTAIDREREKYPDALLLDGGDFSIGSLIHTLTTTHAPELQLMGQMGYDATVIGNHEFDHTGVGLAEMLNVAAESGNRLPAVLSSNYTVSEDNPDRDFIQSALDNYGVAETLLIERGGMTYGIFGLMGVDAHECAPTSGFTLGDAVETATRCVAELEAAGADFIICLSHAGIGPSLEYSEDEVLAEKVSGIDVILSAHTHTTLHEPIVVNGTYIIAAGPYVENLGTITIEHLGDGTMRLKDYYLTPIEADLPDEPFMSDVVEQLKELVGETYLRRYGLTYDQVLTHADFAFKPPATGVQSGSNLGELVADSFLWAVENLEADAPNVTTISVTADGVLRAGFAAGELTTSQAFDVLSMGVGSDGTSGFPLVAVYLTGKEVKAAAEVDASVTPIMPAAQLFMGGIKYTFNANRMFFNRVTKAQLLEAPFVNDFKGGGLDEIDDDALYRVVTGMYSAQMLGTVKSKSMGLLSLEPKMADGTPVTDFNACILRDADGNEIKEWYALAAYLEHFGEDGIPDWYANANGDGRKGVSHGITLRSLLVNLNWITLLIYAVILLVILLTVIIVRVIRRRKKKK